jgi:hypothetical protein
VTPEQIAILNTLVTFAAERVAGGLNEAEREVVELVKFWAVAGEQKGYDYKVINASYFKNAEQAANAYSLQGWRVVGVISSRGPGYANELVLERPTGMTHPDDD